MPVVSSELSQQEWMQYYMENVVVTLCLQAYFDTDYCLINDYSVIIFVWGLVNIIDELNQV